MEQSKMKKTTQIIRDAAKARFCRTIRTGLADARTAPYRKFGFTLAEVLITLGVIGIVAAMTIPTLVQSYKEKVTVTKLKKTYAVLANAYKMAEYENGRISDQFGDNKQSNAQKIYEYIAPYIKVSKVCGFNSGCLPSGKIKDLKGNELSDYDNKADEFKFVMADGVIAWSYMNINSTDDEYIGNIKVDIDGKAGEYTFGKDVFIFTISKNHGMYPAGRANDVSVDNEFDKYCNLSSNERNNGAACTAWVIYNENMDYLHCDDLSWNGKHKCSD